MVRGKPEKAIAYRAWSLVNAIRVNICAWKFSSNHWSSHPSPHRRINSKGKLALCSFKPCQVPSRENQKAVPNTLQYPVVLCPQNWALTNTISSLFLADLFPAASYLPSSNFSSLPNLSSVKENLQGKKLQQQCFQWKINATLHTTISMLIMPTRLLQWKNRRFYSFLSQNTLIPSLLAFTQNT